MSALTAAAVADAFERQAALCAEYGSPFYAGLCRGAAADARAQGPVWQLVRGFAGDPWQSALALRVLGGVHALVLEGSAPALAPHYANAADAAAGALPVAAFVDVVRDAADRLRPWLASPPQTNEVGRSSALLGGFLTVAAAGGPLRILELGSSAGLNLRFDRYRFAADGWVWGPADAKVVLRPRWRGAPPPLGPADIRVRRGCDLSPLDPRDPATRLRLSAFVWPDRPDRLRTLRNALDVAADDDLQVERADAAAWLQARIAEQAPGVATVVFHSSVWGHLQPATREQIADALARAGARANGNGPLHWLRWEDEPRRPGEVAVRHELRLTSWPGGERLLAVGQPHGDWIEWGGTA